MTQRDYYQLLGVPRDASSADIRAAYVRLARAHHPDHAGELPRRLGDVQRAYRCLSDPDQRARHDHLIAQAERAHFAQARRVRRRLRRHDGRRPRPAPPVRWRPILMVGGIGVMLLLASLRLIG